MYPQSMSFLFVGFIRINTFWRIRVRQTFPDQCFLETSKTYVKMLFGSMLSGKKLGVVSAPMMSVENTRGGPSLSESTLFGKFVVPAKMLSMYAVELFWKFNAYFWYDEHSKKNQQFSRINAFLENLGVVSAPMIIYCGMLSMNAC